MSKSKFKKILPQEDEIDIEELRKNSIPAPMIDETERALKNPVGVLVGNKPELIIEKPSGSTEDSSNQTNIFNHIQNNHTISIIENQDIIPEKNVIEQKNENVDKTVLQPKHEEVESELHSLQPETSLITINKTSNDVQNVLSHSFNDTDFQFRKRQCEEYINSQPVFEGPKTYRPKPSNRPIHHVLSGECLAFLGYRPDNTFFVNLSLALLERIHSKCPEMLDELNKLRELMKNQGSTLKQKEQELEKFYMELFEKHLK